ncbi:SDR family NAD(P)-dependent oxidoreductase [Fibrella aquatilis]|uniref:SDR family oxidoreductase n=1 Tax=Fibrella aquatilis TaxID=2817059 RepID=A0A939GAT3_9BACT|nr:SDR family oxidoreductase [Fibrella aquatilis]MBO0933246.1 SDR family oxidoreductase [Fibrella aquatilis]
MARNIGLWALLGVGAVVALRSTQRRNRRISFQDKTVVITGGSRGLGLVMARQLAQEGARIAICARTQAQLDIAEAELRAMGAAVYAHRCDLTDTDALRDFFVAVRETLGPVDVLINNAGIILAGPYANTTDADFHDAMNSNFWAAYHATNAVLPDMQARRFGRIVNVASFGGKVSVPHLLPYSTSKFALVGYSEGLRAEVARDGVFVTTICPGLIRTGSPRQALVRGQHEKEYAWFKIGDSLPGLSANAEYVAGQIIEAARYGESERIISLPAKFAGAIHGLFPGLMTDVLSLVNTLLPNPDPSGHDSPLKKGKDLETSLTQSFLTTLTEQAVVANNEG